MLILKQIIMDCQVDKLGYRADVQWSLKAMWREDKDYKQKNKEN